jgi:outer membrane protein
VFGVLGYQSVRLIILGMGFVLIRTINVQSETLSQALISAYHNNSTFRSNQANVESTRYKIPEARSGFLPKLTATGSYGGSTRRIAFDANPQNIPPFFGPIPGITGQPGIVPVVLSNQDNPYINRIIGINLDQTLYDSGRTLAQYRFAKAQTAQAEALLDATEQQILLSATSAYMDVVRYREMLRLRDEDIVALMEQNRQVHARHAVGELTMTDVAQSEAVLAEAQAMRALAVADVEGAEAIYHQVIGQSPKKLRTGYHLPKGLPQSQEEALNRIQAHHPNVRAVEKEMHASMEDEQVASSDFGPTITLSASVSYRTDSAIDITFSTPTYQGSLKFPHDRQNIVSVVGKLNMPLYDGGRASSRTRGARARTTEARFRLQATYEQAQASAIRSWARYRALKKNLYSAKERVKAENLALDGLERESVAGQRTILDVLNGRRSLLNARVMLVNAEIDYVVAAYTLLNATGDLSLKSLGLQ